MTFCVTKPCVMKWTILITAAAAIAVCATSAQAREHHHHYRRHLYDRAVAAASAPQPFGGFFGFPSAQNIPGSGFGQQSEGYGRRPGAWCGWEMRHLVGSDPGAAYNLARNWAHWGQAGPAGVGAVVVWRHHVGKIVGQEGGEWIIESGNDGHATRTRPRSIAGAIAIRWG
jgi:hypothetical protein